MKTSIIILSIGFVFSSCLKQTDNTQLNQTCTGDSCTTISGRFTTGNDKPIANVPVEIASETTGLLGQRQEKLHPVKLITTVITLSHLILRAMSMAMDKRHWLLSTCAILIILRNFWPCRFTRTMRSKNILVAFQGKIQW